MDLLWCWRCKKHVPMISEEERKALWTHSDNESVMMECQRLTGFAGEPHNSKVAALASAFQLRATVR
jgi:hypothetical protein